LTICNAIVNLAIAHLLVGSLLPILRLKMDTVSKSVYAFNVAIKVLRDTLYLATNSSGNASLLTALHISVAIFGDPHHLIQQRWQSGLYFWNQACACDRPPFFASLDLQRHHDTFEKPGG
jgi:hypothetical protein